MASNFDFLQGEWPQIHASAKNAERDALFDSRSTCFYARRTVEAAVRWLYTVNGLDKPYKDDLSARIHDPAFQAIVPGNVQTKLDLIRRAGNHAVHDDRSIGQESGIRLLEELFHVLSWLARTYATQPESKPTPEQKLDRAKLPKPGGGAAVAKTMAQLQKLGAELERKDAQLEEAAGARADLTEQLLARDEQLKAADAAHASLEELVAKLRAEVATAQAAAARQTDTHDYDEARTRSDIIDLLLREAGWDVDAPRVREYPVTGMPDDKNGFVDYVLWGTDGLPLALVEAKRTSKEATIGQHQAKLYADCLETMHGQRPIIFYTNGFDTWLWDDTNYPPRQVEGFYTCDELMLEIQRRATRKKLGDVDINRTIVERPYQTRAIRNVTEGFEINRQRAALLVMATGSGKTRTVIALSDMLMRANWAKRILFLADRKALVKQAVNAYKTFLPDASPVNLLTEKNTDGRIYVSTYPTMMGLINDLDNGRRRFGPGHFDLVVIDEAHRSVYQKYRRIFEYFDSYLLGLTATPKDEIDYNTYQLFNLETGVPTDDYSLDEAIKDGYLVPPRAVTVPLAFPRSGIKYDDLSDEEKKRWEGEDWGEDVDPDEFPDEVSSEAVNKWLFNTDTVDKALEVLMTRGHRVAGGDRLGKTIIFAKNQKHADFIAQRFDHNYPQYNGKFAAVITHAVSHGQDLIDQFSQPTSDPHIAISVDMLDTGVDVPDVVNLVFFKPVRSKTKFWQMVGRGTRLRPDLYGPGQDKTDFFIFDLCGNVEFFNAHPAPAEARLPASLSERLFTARTDFVWALDRSRTSSELREQVTDVLHTQVAGMDLDNFLVRPRRRQVEVYRDRNEWESLTEQKVRDIVDNLADLPTTVRDTDEMAKRFDLIVLRGQLAVIEADDTTLERQEDKVRVIAEGLLEQLTIPKIKAKEELLREVASEEWWEDVTPEMLEDARKELRSLVGLLEKTKQPVIYTDLQDTFNGDVTEVDMPNMATGTDKERFNAKIRDYLRRQPDNLALQKLRTGKPLTQNDLDSLDELLARCGAGSQKEIQQAIDDARGLPRFVRSLVGLERDTVNETFGEFVSDTNATADQIHFIGLIVDFLTRHGEMEPAQLFERPFTDSAPQGPTQVFDTERVSRLVQVIEHLSSSADQKPA
ncbi:DEAD/DEAH box helicase family protein [Gordonia sp. UCD-TK1]|uniref:DEAD/DEAH box helicase family protein n=1 Tax=Gordonia sp. UCD-TK1 TaxID=1857893 RepID=UPI00080DF31B|nr:DEAD/DEAH box helicase family protein [Gordonia sp. UCD-TK1]OCH81140.1 restriction endonuclease subunit R [Gordonia sp. UCD-TK1]